MTTRPTKHSRDAPKRAELFRRGVGARIRALREGTAGGRSQSGRSARPLDKRQLTLKELSEKTGYSSDHLGRIERGQHALGLDALVAIADALGVKVGDLLPAEAAVPTASVRRIEELRALLMQRDAEEIAWATEVLKTMFEKRPRPRRS